MAKSPYEKIKEGLEEVIAFSEGKDTGAIVHKVPVLPIYPDINVGAGYFKKLLKSDELLVRSIFYTIQGEGPYAGWPAVFLRLGGCNYGGKGSLGIGCDFCDTDFRLTSSKVMKFEDIGNQILELFEKNKIRGDQRLVVITGGEPMLQDNLSDFISEYNHYVIQVETNGTRLAKNFPLHMTWIVVSPKIPVQKLSFGVHKAKYLKLPEEVFYRMDYLKILVSADPKSPYHKLPEYVDAFVSINQEYSEPSPVFISPINVYKKWPKGNACLWDKNLYDYEACAANHAYAAKICMEHGYRLSLQTHLLCAIP
jgi:organic radical activating enzyme